jgi:hypothetical protein
LGASNNVQTGAGNLNYWFFRWLLQRKITEQLTLGGEIFHQTADLIGGSDSAGFNVGGFYDITEHHHLLFSWVGAWRMSRARTRFPTMSATN